MRKRPFLLLELLISLVLFAGIAAVLFSSYRELALAKSVLQKYKEPILERQRLQLRLYQIFSHFKGTKSEQKKLSYHFTYENGADLDPKFRGVLDAMIYIDRGNLTMVSWPEKKEGRTEILFEGVQDFYFQFFDEKTGQWTRNYPEQKPFMIKLKINNTLELPFFL
jgi:hypothetical protein